MRFAASESPDKTDLEKISEFIYKEAELSIAAGIFPVDSSEAARALFESSGKDSRRKNKIVCAVNVNENPSPEVQALNKPAGACAHYGRKNHITYSCNDFKKISVAQRWKVVKIARICFNCLEEGHTRNECQREQCIRCRRKHHELLHFYDSKKDAKNQHTREISAHSSKDNEGTSVSPANS